jgi:hypothetical protein
MMIMRRLPLHREPVEGESFPSYVERLAADLQISLAELLHATNIFDHHSRVVGYGVWLAPERVQMFAAATGLQPARISEMLLSHYEGIAFAHPTRGHAGGPVGVRHVWAYFNGSHFCPACMAGNGGAWLLRWKLPWTHACTTHKALLVDTCPRCHGRPSAGRAGRLNVALPPSLIPNPGHCGHIVRSHGNGQDVKQPGELCGQLFRDIATTRLEQEDPVLVTQCSLDRALTGARVCVGGQRVGTLDYFEDIRSLCALILYAAELEDLGELPEQVANAFVEHVASREERSNIDIGRHAAMRWYLVVPKSAELMAAILPAACRALAAPSRSELSEAIAPVLARAQKRAPVSDLNRIFPFSSRLAATIESGSPSGISTTARRRRAPRSGQQREAQTTERSVLEFMGSHEVRLVLGLDHRRLARWMADGRLATPVARLKCGPIWRRDQIISELRQLYRDRTGLEDEKGMLAWARERALDTARRRGLDVSEIDRLLPARRPAPARKHEKQPLLDRKTDLNA